MVFVHVSTLILTLLMLADLVALMTMNDIEVISPADATVVDSPFLLALRVRKLASRITCSL